MKTVGLAILAAAVTAAAVFWLWPRPETAEDDNVRALQARLEVLTERLDQLRAQQAPTLRTAPAPAPAESEAPTAAVSAEVLARLAELEKKLAERDGRSRREPMEKPGRDDRGDEERARARRVKIETRLADLRAMAPADRHRGFFDLAMQEYKAGQFESQERILQELIQDAGLGEPLAQEASYQIGWARRGRRDFAGAHEVWRRSIDSFPVGHWRRDYARYYAAESAAKAGDKDVAVREVQDLLRDLESPPGNPSENAERRTTILGRARKLLALLDD